MKNMKNMKNIMVDNHIEYLLTNANYKETVEKVDKELQDLKASPEEIGRSLLLLEEIFERWLSGLSLTDEQPIRIMVKKRLGDIKLELRVKGDFYNPIEFAANNELYSGELFLEDEEKATDKVRLAILMANKTRLSFYRRNCENIVFIRVHSLGESKKRLMRTLTGLTIGIAAGILMRYIFGVEFCMEFKQEFLQPTQKLFLNAFNMLAAPVMLFSIMSGMTNMSGATDIRKIGGRLVSVSLGMLVVTTFISVGASVLMFSSDLSYMQTAVISGQSHSHPPNYSLKDLFFGLVPENLIEPFAGQNILQVMFLAILFGLAVKKMINPMPWLLDGIETLNKFFLSVLSLVIPFVPIIVCLAMFSLTATADISSLVALVKVLLGLAIGTFLVFVIGAVTVFIVGRISPLPYLKKAVGFAPIPFSINGSNASLPFVMKFTAEKLGVKQSFVSFLIPIGMQFNKMGQCFFFAMSSAMMLKVFQIELDSGTILTFLVSTLIMAISKPPIPCGGIVCLDYMFGVLGVPTEAVAIIFALEPVSTLFVSIMNATANFTATFCVARMEDGVDEDIYRL